MPTLGFLKKKRTKDSQGSDGPTPTSPQADKHGVGSPITPTTSKGSTLFTEPENTFQDSGNTSGASNPSSTAGGGGGGAVSKASGVAPTSEPQQPQGMNAQAAGQLQGQNPTANTQNVPSIQNLINQPDYSGQQPSQQNDTTMANSGSQSGVPQLNIPQQRPSNNAVRETKGKYTLTDFTISRTLGTGSFGRVHLVQSKHNQRFYAVKVLKKAQVVKMKQVEHTNDERRMLQRCRHPFLITLWGTWQDSKNLYMVMDFIEGGELFSLLRKSQVSHREWRELALHANRPRSASPTPSPSSTPPKSPSPSTTSTA